MPLPPIDEYVKSQDAQTYKESLEKVESMTDSPLDLFVHGATAGLKQTFAGLSDLAGDDDVAQQLREDVYRTYEKPFMDTGISNMALDMGRYIPDAVATAPLVGLGAGLNAYRGLSALQSMGLSAGLSGVGGTASEYIKGDLREDTALTPDAQGNFTGIDESLDSDKLKQSLLFNTLFSPLIDIPMYGAKVASKKALKTRIDNDIKNSDGKVEIASSEIKDIILKEGEVVSENNGIKRINAKKGDENISVIYDGSTMFVDYTDTNNSRTLLEEFAYGEANGKSIVRPLKKNSNVYDETLMKLEKTEGAKQSVYDDIERNIANDYQTDSLSGMSLSEKQDFWYSKQEDNGWSNEQLNNEIRKSIRERDVERPKDIDADIERREDFTSSEIDEEDVKWQSAEDIGDRVSTSPQKAYGAGYSQELKNVNQDVFVNTKYKPVTKAEEDISKIIDDYIVARKSKSPDIDNASFEKDIYEFTEEIQDLSTKSNMTKDDFIDGANNIIERRLNPESDKTLNKQAYSEGMEQPTDYDVSEGKAKRNQKEDTLEDTTPEYDAIKEINKIYGTKEDSGLLGTIRELVATNVKKENGKWKFNKMSSEDAKGIKDSILNDFTYMDNGKKRWISSDRLVTDAEIKFIDKALSDAKNGSYKTINKLMKDKNKFSRKYIDTKTGKQITPEEYIAKKHKKEKIEISKSEDIAKKSNEEQEPTSIDGERIKSSKESRYYTGSKADATNEPSIETIKGQDSHGEYDSELHRILAQEGLSGKNSNAYKSTVIHEYIHSLLRNYSDDEISTIYKIIDAKYGNYKYTKEDLDEIFEQLKKENNGNEPSIGQMQKIINDGNGSKFVEGLKKDIQRHRDSIEKDARSKIEEIKNSKNFDEKISGERIKEIEDGLSERLKQFDNRDIYEELLAYTLSKDIMREYDGSINFSIKNKLNNKKGNIIESYSKLPDMDMDELYKLLPNKIKEDLNTLVYNLHDNPNSLLYKMMNEEVYSEKMIAENVGLFKAIADNSSIAKNGFDSIKDYLDDVSWSGWLSVNAEHSAMMKLAGKIKGYHATENEALAELHKELKKNIESNFKDVKDADNVIGQMQYYGLMDIYKFFDINDFDTFVKKVQDRTFFNKEDIDIASMNYIDSIIKQYPEAKALSEAEYNNIVVSALDKITSKSYGKSSKGKKYFIPAMMSQMIENLVKGKGGSIYTTKAFGKTKKYGKPKTRNMLNNANNADAYMQSIIRAEIKKKLGLKKSNIGYKRNVEFVDFIERQVAVRRFSSALAKKDGYVYKNLDKFKKIFNNKNFKVLVDRHNALTNSLKAKNFEGNIFGVNAHPEYQNSGYKWIISDKVPKEAIASGEKIYGNSRFVLIPDTDITLGKQESILPKGYASDFEKGIDTVSEVFMYDSKSKSFYRYNNGKKEYLNYKSKNMVEGVKDLHNGKYQLKFKIPENSKRRIRSSEGYANIYNYSFSDMFTRNQYLLNQSTFKKGLREKYLRDAQIYGLLYTDESISKVDNPSRYVKVFNENGKDYYAKKKWVAQFSGTKGLEIRNRYAKYMTKVTTGLVDIVRNNLIIGSVSAFVNSFVASTGTFILHSNNKLGAIKSLQSAKSDIAEYLTLLNKHGKALANGKDIELIKKELQSNDVYKAFSNGLQSTIRESNLILGVNERNNVHNMISQYFGVSKGFIDVMETIHLRPNTKVGTTLGNYFDITEIVPKYAMYKEVINRGGKHSEAIDYVNNAFPNYSMNLPEGISALDEVVPFMKFFMSVPKMVHFGLINSPTNFMLMKLMTIGMMMGSYKVLGESEEDEWYKDNNFMKLGDGTYYYTESLSNYNLSTPSPFGLNAFERIYAPVDIMPLTIRD